MSNGVRYTPTFALPSEYEQQAMEARRRRRMAEMLAAQAYQPQDVGVAPIPTAAPLVQGLQAFLAARQERKAEEAAEKASQTESEYAKRLAGRLAGGYVPDFNVPAAEVPEQTELGEVTLTSQKRPAETLQQYQDRMRTAQFTSPTFDQMLARTPEQTALEPITPTARYKRLPEEALAMAETDVGMAAMKNRPMLAARLAKLLETPDAEEFYAPTETKTGLVQFGKRGGIRKTKFEAAPKETAPTTLARLQTERDALPPGDPRIALYDRAIQSEVGSKAPITKIDLGEKGDVKAQELFLTEISKVRPQAQAATSIIKSVNNLDKLTEKGTFVGSLAPTAVGASQFLKGFGINVSPEVLANTEAFQAQVSDLTLSMQSALGGARGFTEKETEMLNRMFPQIVNSPEARIAIAEIIRNKQLQIIDDYDSLINDYQTTFPTSRIPYKKVDDEEVRYQRWKRQQTGNR